MMYVFELHFTTGSGQCNRRYVSPAALKIIICCILSIFFFSLVISIYLVIVVLLVRLQL